MPDPVTLGLVSGAVFAGAFVSGFAGFAFSAVAGTVLLHVFPAPEAVPLMMVCSIVIQAINLVALRGEIRWTNSAPLILGGLIGVPLAVALLQSADTALLRAGFGAVVACYALAMLCRPAAAAVVAAPTPGAPPLVTLLVGAGGGFVGGLTAMPGAVPTLWCDWRRMPKAGQRGLVQPYIAVMQLAALAVLLARRDMPAHLLRDVAVSVPAMLAGSLLGLVAFRHVGERGFRRALLVLLLVSGGALVVA
jgi:uncharacterized membrane protein YfcA